jgi:hypothetical protein
MKLQSRGTSCTNIRVWKNKIVKLLWVTRVSDSDYLKKLVESMPRRVAEVIEKDSAITRYWSHYEINCVCTFVVYFYIFSNFSDRSVMFFLANVSQGGKAGAGLG